MKSEGRGEEEDEKAKEAWVRVKELGNKRNKLSREGSRQEQGAR